MNEITNNKVNLCDSCSQVYPDCTSKPEDVYFGDGVGHDNICACSEYRPSAQPECTRECMPMYADVSDCISRQAAVDAVGSMLRRKFGIGGDLAEITLEDLPPAQPQRMKGRWVFYETENDRYDDMRCPFCKKSYTVDAYRIDDIGFTAEDFNYCPNCGAWMSEESEPEHTMEEFMYGQDLGSLEDGSL